MKHILIIFSVSLILVTNCSQPKQHSNHSPIREKISFEDLQSQFLHKNDTLYAINFWATWCKPCIEELPDFMEIQEEMKDKAFTLILVSLDKPSDFESTVIPFLEKRSISADTYLLTDITTMNIWIPLIDSTWTGSIPATVFYKNKEKIDFHQEKLSKNTLHTIITNNL
ncbi:MAG: TlpA disulfide reductase family protein [Bacteroidales bacterium]|jgi:thiol-disulfide isomerase/thioredoxin|nr:TlpA disulfide reductase family protein [Bacteroidales bacterium]